MGLYVTRTNFGFYGIGPSAEEALKQARKAGAKRRKNHQYYTIFIEGAEKAAVDVFGTVHWEPPTEEIPQKIAEGIL